MLLLCVDTESVLIINCTASASCMHAPDCMVAFFACLLLKIKNKNKKNLYHPADDRFCRFERDGIDADYKNKSVDNSRILNDHGRCPNILRAGDQRFYSSIRCTVPHQSFVIPSLSEE